MRWIGGCARLFAVAALAVPLDPGHALTLTDSTVFNCASSLNDFVVVQENATFNALSGCAVTGYATDLDGFADYSVRVEGSGVANFYDGSSIEEDLETSDSSYTGVFGGSFGNDIEPFGQSVIEIFGDFTLGDILEDPELGATLRINRGGSGSCSEPKGPLPRNEAVSLVCTFEDGGTFEKEFFLSDSEGIVEIVPEPALLPLLILGAVRLLGRDRKAPCR